MFHRGEQWEETAKWVSGDISWSENIQRIRRLEDVSKSMHVWLQVEEGNSLSK